MIISNDIRGIYYMLLAKNGNATQEGQHIFINWDGRGTGYRDKFIVSDGKINHLSWRERLV